MNWESFSVIGYLGVALGVAAVLTWFAYGVAKKRILCQIGLGLSIAALACAKINSSTHVNRIAIDPALKLAEAEARKQARRQAALDSRGEEVAQIRFAEDSGEEFLDRAGMDEADLKYLESFDDGGEPAWKKEKKTRSGGGADDDTLEGLIDDEEQEGGADVAELEEKAAPDPILMSEADAVMANRIDRWNLRGSEYLIAVALLMLVLDYLRRFNIYKEATRPLPFPSGIPNAVTPIAPIIERPDSPRRDVLAELRWIVQRGDSFLYLTDNPTNSADTVARLAGMKVLRRPLELLQLDEATDRIDDDFVFEALWFKRGSFVVDSPERTERMMKRFLELFRERRTTRARARQNVHIVWDRSTPVPESLRQAFVDFGGPAGFSLLVV